MKIAARIAAIAAASALTLTGAGCAAQGTGSTQAAGNAAATTKAAANTKAATTAAQASASATTAAKASASSGQAVTLKVWGAKGDQELLQQMVDSFKAQYTDKTYNITLGVVGEPDASKTVLADPAAAADVFSLPNDQLGDLVNAGTLYEITGDYLANVQQSDTPDSIAAATVGGKVYAFPATADNGYFLYYDKSVLKDTDVQTLDGIVAAAKAKNMKVMIDLPNAWYLASFFLGAGCKISIDSGGAAVCDWNSANGLKAANAVKAFADSGVWQSPGSSGDSTLTAGIGTTICAGVSGTWNATAIQKALGDKYAACKLPTFTGGGSQVQMGSFSGYKFEGVSAATQFPADALKLAQWLTNQQNQLLRLQKAGYGPSNIQAAKDPAVTANPALSALAAQMPFATVQNNVPGSFWTPAGALGAALSDPTNKTDVQTLLDQMVQAVKTPASGG